MLHFRRFPAAIALVVTLALGVFSTVVASQKGGGGTIAQLEAKIGSGQAKAVDWFNYGDRLAEVSRHKEAAEAYLNALKSPPEQRDAAITHKAKVGRATSLALGKDEDQTHTFLRELMSHDAKLANDLMGRPEFKALIASDPRFEVLAREARAQAMD